MRRSLSPLMFLVMFCFSFSVAQKSVAQESVAKESNSVATVGGEPITESELDALVASIVPPGIDPSDEVRKFALDHLIDRAIVRHWLRESEWAASDAEVVRRIARLRDELQRINQTLADYFRLRGSDEPALRRRMEWEIAWPRYVRAKLGDEDLAAWYESRHEQYDGTERHVAHILWTIDSTENLQTAAQVHSFLLAGEIEWADAVKTNSQSATKASGGDLGWIKFSGPMERKFSTAAFSLAAGEISPPVVSPFGVHLITCLAVRPGTLEWQDVADEVRRDAARELFVEAVTAHRGNVEVVR